MKKKLTAVATSLVVSSALAMVLLSTTGATTVLGARYGPCSAYWYHYHSGGWWHAHCYA